MSELPKLESVSSEPSENVGNALTEESSSESHRSGETSTAKETESNLIGTSLDKNASEENADYAQNTATLDEPLGRMVSETMDPKVSDEESKNDQILDTLKADSSNDEPIAVKKTEGTKEILKTNDPKDECLTLEVTEDSKDNLKDNDLKAEPITIEMAEGSNAVVEESSKCSESVASEAIVLETALEPEDLNAGDAEAEKMEIETEVLNPETEEPEDDVEMEEENSSNDEKVEISSSEEKKDLSSEEQNENCPRDAKIENPPSGESIENPESEEKEESLSCEENNENPSNGENNEMEIDQDVAEESTSSAKPEMEVDLAAAAEESTSATNSEKKPDVNTSEKNDVREEEIEVIEDSSGAKSMDSGTSGVQTDVNASEKVTVMEEEMKSEDNAAAAGKETEKKKVLFMPIDFGIDPGPLQEFTAKEIMDFLGQKVTEYMMNPEINRLLRVQMESIQLRDQVRAKTEELHRLQAFMEKLNRDQDKFLRHFGIIPKIPTADKSVYVDWASVESVTATKSASSAKKNVKEQIQKNEQLTLTPCGTSPKSSASATNAASGSSVLKKSPGAKKDGPVECIDLTDEVEAPSKTINKAANSKTYSGYAAPMKSANKLHPAPLPIMPNRVNRYLKEAPPKPRVKISCDDKGIILQWDADITDKHEKLQCFEIFGYQEQKNQNITSALWKRIGNVKTLSLPMACTLTKFVPGNNYHFTVRGLDIHNRPGIFSDPVSTRFDPVVKKP